MCLGLKSWNSPTLSSCLWRTTNVPQLKTNSTFSEDFLVLSDALMEPTTDYKRPHNMKIICQKERFPFHQCARCQQPWRWVDSLLRQNAQQFYNKNSNKFEASSNLNKNLVYLKECSPMSLPAGQEALTIVTCFVQVTFVLICKSTIVPSMMASFLGTVGTRAALSWWRHTHQHETQHKRPTMTLTPKQGWWSSKRLAAGKGIFICCIRKGLHDCRRLCSVAQYSFTATRANGGWGGGWAGRCGSLPWTSTRSVIKGPYLPNIFLLRFSYAVLNSVFKLITSTTLKSAPVIKNTLLFFSCSVIGPQFQK